MESVDLTTWEYAAGLPPSELSAFTPFESSPCTVASLMISLIIIRFERSPADPTTGMLNAFMLARLVECLMDEMDG